MCQDQQWLKLLSFFPICNFCLNYHLIYRLLYCFILIGKHIYIKAGWRVCVDWCVSNVSGNGLSPVRRQAITGLLWIGRFATNVSRVYTWIRTFPFKKMHTKMSSGTCQPFCLRLNVARNILNVSKTFPGPLLVAGFTIFIETTAQIAVVHKLASSEMQYFDKTYFIQRAEEVFVLNHLS